MSRLPGPLVDRLLNRIWQRTFPFKALIAIVWDLQPLGPSSLTKPDLLRFRCSSGHVLSKTKSVTPHFFTFLTSLNHYLSMVKFSEKKSMLENFRAKHFQNSDLSFAAYKMRKKQAQLEKLPPTEAALR